MPDNLFAAVFPTGISYCDTSREENGDYKRIAMLFFSDLTLKIHDPRSPLLAEVKAAAATLQARKGEPFQVSTAGQCITLGYALKETR